LGYSKGNARDSWRAQSTLIEEISSGSRYPAHREQLHIEAGGHCEQLPLSNVGEKAHGTRHATNVGVKRWDEEFQDLEALHIACRAGPKRSSSDGDLLKDRSWAVGSV